MLTHFEVEGFKSIGRVGLDLGKITVLIGPNGSGKSSIIHALEVLKQSLGYENIVTSGQLVDLGSFDDVVSLGKKQIRFVLGGVSKMNGAPFVSVRSTAEYGYTLICGKRGIVSSYADMSVNGFSLNGEFKRGRELIPHQIQVGKDSRLDYMAAPVIGLPLTRTGGSRGKDEEELYIEASETLNNILGVIQADLRATYFVPACRGLEKSKYALEDKPYEDIVDASGMSVQASRLASTIAYKRLEDEISKRIKRVTGIHIKHKLVPQKQVTIETPSEINIINEGFGTNQLVHLFAQIETSPPGSLIAIEEPEIHLHPRAQAAIADVLLDITEEENKHLLISTHSEHFLFRLLTNVVSGKIESQELALYSFELKDGLTEARRLEVAKNGRISGGLKDFFEVDLEEFRRFLGVLKP